MTDKQEILERQHEEGNPLLDLYKGAVAVLEEAKKALITSQPGDITSALLGVRNYLTAISDAGVAECMIIKVQRPLATNMPSDQPVLYLVYNEDRSLMDHVTLEDPAIVDMFGGDPKMYVNARLWVDGTLQIIDRTDDQDW